MVREREVAAKFPFDQCNAAGAFLPGVDVSGLLVAHRQRLLWYRMVVSIREVAPEELPFDGDGTPEARELGLRVLVIEVRSANVAYPEGAFEARLPAALIRGSSFM